MREDMAKVIVERPRIGRGWMTKRPRNRWRNLPMDEWPLKESHKQEWRDCPMKMLNENLAPLRRFLRSCVGRPWNDVVSELRERINLNSAVQLHIWQHVQQYVCTNQVQFDRLINNRFGFPVYDCFYVEDGTGILREFKSRRRRRKKQVKPFIRIDRWTICRKLNGIWFVINLKPIPGNLDTAWDVIFHKTCRQLSINTLYEFYGQCAYAAGKRQLNKKEIANVKSRQMLRKNNRRKK